jgi:hypothetical protein
MLWKKIGKKLQFSATYPSQIDGQTKVMHRSLGNILKYLAGNKPK